MARDRATDDVAKKAVISLWRDVEMFNVTTAPRVRDETDKKVGVFRQGDRLPWIPGHPGHLKPTSRDVWFHRVFIGIADQREAVRRIVEANCGLGSIGEEELDRLYGRCWGFTVLLDWHGRPIRETYEPASFAVAGVLLSKGRGLADAAASIDALKMAFLAAHPADETATLDPLPPDEPRHEAPLAGAESWADEIDPMTAAGSGLKAKKSVLPPAEDDDGNPVTIGAEPLDWRHFERELRVRQTLFGKASEDEPDLIMESLSKKRARYDAKKRVKQELPDTSFMNSFFLRDLARLSDPEAQIGKGPLSVYLDRGPAPAKRTDLLKDLDAMIEATRPERLALGRWPSPVEHSLMLAQQAAVGEVLHGKSPLIAVNGPPGTGKTTLLREVIADIVVRRALAISRLSSPRQAFSRNSIYFGDHSVAVWNPEVVDGFGIVVSSSNNAAVENISLELPARKSIATEQFPQAGYLAPVAPLVAEGAGGSSEAWGLIAARLGSKRNCSNFFKSAMPYKDAPSMTGGRAALGDHLFNNRERENANWPRRVERVLSLHRQLTQGIEAMTRDHASLRAKSSAAGPAGFAGTRPDKLFRTRSAAERHLSSLWVHPELEQLRTDLFLASLRLIESTLAVNAREVMGNMRAAHALLAKPSGAPAGPEVRREIWNTVFAVTPVVSTTLASVEKLFTGMAEGSLGWLLVDEAGQAVPQAVTGALWRARRAVIIGDPLQVEPVQTIPAPMIEKLRDSAGIDPAFSPATASAQTVADRTMAVGGMIAMPDAAPIWTGMPLRAHRRCAEPMFSISNSISYAGQMVQAGAKPAPLTSVLGASSWTDVIGTGGGGHVVREEMAELERVLRLMKKSWPAKADREATIFIITPFRRVDDAVHSLLRKLKLDERIDCGTIHRFQGREADIVLLVLGSAPGTAGLGARSWASSRSNMLNVALTRARSRIHVIGSYADWSCQAFFGELAQRMMAANRVLERETEMA